MKISPVAISATPQAETRVSKGPGDQSKSDGALFLAVMNEFKEVADQAIEGQKAETAAEAGSSVRPDATPAKLDNAAIPEVGFETVEISDPSPPCPAPVATPNKVTSRVLAKSPDPTPLIAMDDPVLSAPFLPTVSPQLLAEEKRAMDPMPAGPEAAEISEEGIVEAPAAGPTLVPARAGEIQVPQGNDLAKVQVGEATISVQDSPGTSAAPAEPSVMPINKRNSAPENPGIENRQYEKARTPSSPAPAINRWKSPEAKNQAVTNQTIDSLVVKPARVSAIPRPTAAEDAISPLVVAEQDRSTQPAAKPNLNEAGTAGMLRFVAEPSILRNSSSTNTEEYPMARKSETSVTLEAAAIVDASAMRRQLSPAAAPAKLGDAEQSSLWADSGERWNPGKSANAAAAANTSNTAHASSGKPGAAQTTETDAPTGKPQSDPTPPAKEAVPAAVEAGGIRKTNSGIKDHGPSPLSPAGSISAGESASVSLPRPAPQAANRTPEFILQLADRIQMQLRSGESEIRIQLKPELLGQLEIRAESSISGIVARIVAESGSVREYLENNLPILHQSFQDQGLKVDRVEVVLQDSFDARQSAPQQQPFNQTGQGGGGAAHHRIPGMTDSQSSSVAPDELIVDPLSWLVLGPNSTFHTVA